MTLMVNIDNDYENSLHKIVDELLKNKLAIIPTDTIYGIVGLMNSEVVDKIFDAKCRSSNKPIAIMINDLNLLDKYISFHNNHLFLLQKHLPGMLTVIGRNMIEVSDKRISFDGKIGVRIPNHKLCYDLVRLCDSPLLLTSANISGALDSKSVSDFPESLVSKIAIIGESVKLTHKPSTVVDISEERIKILRYGAVVL